MLEEPSKDMPSRFGRYRIFSKLAAGGMATVYLARTAHESGFEKIVALKVIHDHLADQKAFVDMFLDEARLAASIDHPNVCSVFDFGRQRGVYYLAMEFLLGAPLKRVLRTVVKRRDREEIKRLPWYTARLIAEAAEGLHAAHELRSAKGEPLGVVHRDVSPGNIVVTYDGAVKIVDFGVAKAAERIHQTKVAKLKGKYAYVAPEQLRDEGVDRRSDVWSLGVCLWEALTLRRLFRRDSDAATLSAVVFDEIPAPSSVSPWVPQALDAIVLKALARDRDQRYRTARAMGQDLRKFLTTTGMTVGTAEVSEWMELLFPGERESRLAQLQQAREGQPSDSFSALNVEEESSTEDGTLPSVSRLVSAETAALLRTGISLHDLGDLVREHHTSCDPEVAGLVAMDVCDGLHDRPAVVVADQIRISESGRVSLASPLDRARASASARSIIAAFSTLPMAEGALRELLHSAEFRSPDELNEALQRAIDPMARGRARKALVRLLQLRRGPETLRPARPETPDAALEPAAASHWIIDAEAPRAPEVQPQSAPETRPQPVERKGVDDTTTKIPLAASSAPVSQFDPDEFAGEVRGHGLRNLLLLVMVLGAAATAVALLAPDTLRGWLGSPAPEPERVAEPIVREAPLGEVLVRVATEGARVLRFVGRAPVDIPDVPMGSAQQVLATQSGRPDAWAVVSADALWSDAEEPRFELAVQIPEEGETPEMPPLMSGADSERAGTLRVITTPPGAKVFRVVGVGPEVRITGVHTDEVLELLVMRDGYQTHRELVTTDRWLDPERPRVEIDVTLPELPREHHHRRRRSE
ncbi:MAG: serine/threonine protein kinase [Deltaproteobacteria bacterium]|nr:serine/threonine protein kinase [Deltaproteobacteria bacterium]